MAIWGLLDVAIVIPDKPVVSYCGAIMAFGWWKINDEPS
jgi:hypothetical protein